MKTRYVLLFLLTCVTSDIMEAQESYTGISYSTSAPIGNTQDYVENYSWRGMALEGQWFVGDDISVGGYVAWNVFKDRLSGEFENGTQTVSGTQQRFENTIPIYFDSKYFWGEPAEIRPYAGLSVGTIWVEQLTQMGIFEVTTSAWQFAISPNAGVFFPFGRSSLHLGLRYNQGFEGGDIDSQSYLSVNLGFAWWD